MTLDETEVIQRLRSLCVILPVRGNCREIVTAPPAVQEHSYVTTSTGAGEGTAISQRWFCLLRTLMDVVSEVNILRSLVRTYVS